MDIGCSVLVTVDNRRLGLVMEQHALIVQRSLGWDGSPKWKSTERSSIRSGKAAVPPLENVEDISPTHETNFRLEPDTLETASALVQRKAQKDMVDYDNHLDDLAKDFLNSELNEAYDI